MWAVGEKLQTVGEESDGSGLLEDLMLKTKTLLIGGTVLTSALLFFSGCGSDNPSQPGLSIPQGTGSGTMMVIGEVAGSDPAPGIYITDFMVSLADTGGSPISGASVEITTPSEVISLVEDAGSAGTYRAARNGYVPGNYSLVVTRGSDWVSGIRVTAPDLHLISSPASGDTVTADQPLNVVWTRTVAAVEATVECRDYESAAPELDDGQSVIPGSGNPIRDDQRIRVFRLNRVLPAGGLPGSKFEARIRNSVEPVIAL